MIIPAANVETARNVAECLSDGGVNMFTTKLGEKIPRVRSPQENFQQLLVDRPVTHYISSGFIDAQFVSLFSNGTALYNAAATLAASRGKTLTATLQDCIDLVAAADVSDEVGLSAINRLNLQLI